MFFQRKFTSRLLKYMAKEEQTKECEDMAVVPIRHTNMHDSRSHWPRGLRRRPAAARLLRSWFRIPPGAWMFVDCECCMLSGRGLCDELITRPEETYRLWCVVACDLENLKNEEAMTRGGSQRHRGKRERGEEEEEE